MSQTIGQSLGFQLRGGRLGNRLAGIDDPSPRQAFSDGIDNQWIMGAPKYYCIYISFNKF